MKKCKVIFISCLFFLLIGITPTLADNVPEGADWKYALKPYHVAKKDLAPWLNFYDGIAVVKVDGYYGAINQEGKIVIPLKYDSLSSRPAEGLLNYKLQNERGYLDLKGNVVHSGRYDLVKNFNEGLAVVKKDGLYGMIDKSGNWVLQPEYTSLNTYSEGLVFAEKDNLRGFIDKTGKLVIPFENNIAGTGFTNGISVFSKKTNDNFTYGVMDKTGKVLIPPIYIHINSGPFIFGYIWTEDEYGKWDAWDANGNKKTPVQLDFMPGYSENMFSIQINDKIGFMDDSFKIVIKPQYEKRHSLNFSDGLAVVRKDEQFGVIDKQGKVIVPFGIHSVINSYQEGVAYASRGGRWGFIDKTGKEVKNLPFKYEDADSFSEGLAAVKINGKWGAVNRSGKLIIPAKYDMIYQFKNGVAVITYKGKDGMINKNGKVIVEPEFDQILDHYMASMDTGNIFSVYKDGKWGFIILNHDAADVKP